MKGRKRGGEEGKRKKKGDKEKGKKKCTHQGERPGRRLKIHQDCKEKKSRQDEYI